MNYCLLVYLKVENGWTDLVNFGLELFIEVQGRSKSDTYFNTTQAHSYHKEDYAILWSKKQPARRAPFSHPAVPSLTSLSFTANNKEISTKNFLLNIVTTMWVTCLKTLRPPFIAMKQGLILAGLPASLAAWISSSVTPCSLEHATITGLRDSRRVSPLATFKLRKQELMPSALPAALADLISSGVTPCSFEHSCIWGFTASMKAAFSSAVA
uniref:SFRICE_005202 n=1 Tax=Spodoptera frugiperda TaxID=7108 RepID=A0A2H1WZ46_SPOFR